MARPATSPPLPLPLPSPQPANLPVDQMRKGVRRLSRRIADLEAFEPHSVQMQWPPEVTALQNAIDEALTLAFGHQTIEYNRYKAAARLNNSNNMAKLARDLNGRGSESQDVSDARKSLTAGKQKSLVLLHQAIKGLQEEIADRESLTRPTELRDDRQSDLSKVFVVHGHDDGARQAVARFLERLELEAIILQEQPDQGLTIIEKFETYANHVGFAVVLLTPDDIGGAALAPAQALRARQNVIFELGYFAGKLGRGRACLMRKGEVEIPSDLYGVIYTEMDAAEGWKLKLAKELKAAGLKFDGDKVFA
ncbi:MAG: nucleotide-binding protein [Rhodopila sp.]|nr:nucleotide-binding protein [Rhodopila sp.]